MMKFLSRIFKWMSKPMADGDELFGLDIETIRRRDQEREIDELKARVARLEQKPKNPPPVKWKQRAHLNPNGFVCNQSGELPKDKITWFVKDGE